ncbi:hypothetical protein G6F32_014969 [Rhizopus arrhizus]|nr:hypothetical protein G6F32_014969 [Rhizopus arrhizus]
MPWRCQPVSPPGGKRHSVTVTMSVRTDAPFRRLARATTKPCSMLMSAPSAARRASTPSTSTCGAEAPAVTPMCCLPATHAGSISCAPSIRYDSTPSRRASSLRRLELELFGEPTTSTRSQRLARSRTASWRFCVA